jgi:hypothetical protein
MKLRLPVHFGFAQGMRRHGGNGHVSASAAVIAFVVSRLQKFGPSASSNPQSQPSALQIVLLKILQHSAPAGGKCRSNLKQSR